VILSSILEVTTRLVIDPVYFYSINPYLSPSALTHFKPEDLLIPEPEHIDLLFIGSSRVAASIEEEVFETNTSLKAINTGRGFFTGGTHYLALQEMIEKNPEFLSGTKVFIELPGGVIYPRDSAIAMYDVYEGSTHFLLPHISFKDVRHFWESRNSFKEKKELTLQFFFSSYRTYPFIREYKSRMYNRILSRFKEPVKENLSTDGGIKTESFDLAKETAINVAKRQIENQRKAKSIKIRELDKSIIASFNRLVRNHGGELILFEVPLHSIQKEAYSTPFAKKNKAVFRQWADQNNVKIVSTNDFIVNDKDFPDYWHLNKEKKLEFSRHLLDKL